MRNSAHLQDLFLVLRYTRHWIHYGFLAHVVFFVLAAAVQGIAASIE